MDFVVLQLGQYQQIQSETSLRCLSLICIPQLMVEIFALNCIHYMYLQAKFMYYDNVKLHDLPRTALACS